MDCRLYYLVIFSLVPILSPLRSTCDAQSIATDIEGLLAFKAAADLGGGLNQSWTGVTNPCGNSSSQAKLRFSTHDSQLQRERTEHSSKRLSTRDIILIIVADAMALIFIVLALALYYFRKYSREINEKGSNKLSEQTNNDGVHVDISTITEPERTKLAFFEGSETQDDLEDLLRASAEMLRKGSFGTAYKAGKWSHSCRREVKDRGRKEFDQKMEMLGSLRHPNLFPLRAFYYAREAKLFVYDFMPNGSLLSLLHGNRGPGRTPLGWNSRPLYPKL